MTRSIRTYGFVFVLILISVYGGCVPASRNLSQAGAQTLANQWMTSKSPVNRAQIVAELERRRDAEGLVLCLQNALILDRSVRSMPVPKPTVKPGDIVPIIDALGRIGDPGTVDAIYTAHQINHKQIHTAILKALRPMASPGTGPIAAGYLKDPDGDIRLLALEILQVRPEAADPEAVEAVLFDDHPLVRWKALHVLGAMGDPDSVDKVSILLSDADESVRQAAEAVLHKLGVPGAQVAAWKQKAARVSLDEVYRTKIAYQKAVSEKRQLQEELDTQAEIKRKLEAAIHEHEVKLRRKEAQVRSLYEKERRFMDKLNQLELSAAQTEQYRRELTNLNARLASLNREIGAAKENDAAERLTAELQKTQQEKTRIEKDAREARAQEADLKKEISHFKRLAEKTRREAERAQSEVALMRNRETFLTQEVDSLRKQLDMGMEPMLLISSPENGASVTAPSTLLNIFAVDDKGIENISVTVNDRPVHIEVARKDRGIAIEGETDQRKIYIAQRLSLDYGKNTIRVTATDINGAATGQSITITRTVERGKILAAVIGINDYQTARDLKYAVNDAAAFKRYLKGNLGIREDNLFFLSDAQATKDSIQSLLGTRIKRQAALEDTVMIFFAGHGAVETDPSNPDGDGFEKYLLPFDADLNDLYTTAISMDEIRKIFHRIRAERLIFIADTCYSGASGGRTILSSKTRASLSDRFYDRISKGKGRVIIASCSANEVSKEDDTHQHGLFTYYLLKGLRGSADYDSDGLITVDEAFGYLSKTVPRASGQDQHPVKKGESEGQLIIGRTH
jgi:hypothetical protein